LLRTVPKSEALLWFQNLRQSLLFHKPEESMISALLLPLLFGSTLPFNGHPSGKWGLEVEMTTVGNCHGFLTSCEGKETRDWNILYKII
jgi:hypothetical protein